jgi:hypothetical protein
MELDITGFAAELTGRGLLSSEQHAAFLVGSSARGWNNSRSDHDFYLVSSGFWRNDTFQTMSVPLNPPTLQTEVFYVDGRRWDVTNWQDGHVDQMLTKVSWAEFDRGLVAGQVLSVKEEAFLDRLSHCVPVTGADWVTERREALAKTAFRSFLVVRSLGAMDDSVEDALGQLESRETDSAVLSARKALGHAADALLEHHGEYGSHSPKWRAHRFRAAKPDILSLEQYWDLETMRTYDPADPAAWVTEVLTVCQDISMKVEI